MNTTATDQRHRPPVFPNPNRPAACRRPRLALALLALAATALAGPGPVRATPGPNGPANPSVAPPASAALDWLAELGLSAGRRPASDLNPQQQRLAAAYARLPLSFEANVGQSDPQVRFLAHGPGYTLFLTEGAEAVLAGANGPAVRLALEGANPAPVACALEGRAAKSAYFLGNDPARWRTQIAHYGRVRFEAVYPGIDLVYYGAGRRLECDWVVAPGADPGRIQLRVGPGTPVRLEEASGELALGGAGQTVRLQKPVAYQMVEGRRVAVAARYVVLGAGERVGLELGGYDAGRPLVIDPVLVYSTYLGGSDYDYGFAIAVDRAGNAYVTGQTASADFPLAHPLVTNSGFKGDRDVFVSKLSFDPRSGTLHLAYSTYLGGSGFDAGNGIAVDARGSAYVTGYTQSADFPTAHPLASGAMLRSASLGNAFVSKLSFDERSGTLRLAYSTYLGGSNFEQGYGIAVDAWGNAYVTGFTTSADFPLAHPLASGAALRAPEDAFVSKLSFDPRSGALSLAYSTYLGSSGGLGAAGIGIAVDAWGNAYVTGATQSNFPLAHPLATNFRGYTTAFVSKLSFDSRSGALSLAYSTYLGGGSGGGEQGIGIAVDAWGNAYVTGYTGSTDFPLAHPLASGAALRGPQDAFVSKLSFDPRSGALSLAYSTYLGGSDSDQGFGIAVDALGNAYVTGLTSSTDFPLAHPLATNTTLRAQFGNAFVSKLSFDERRGTLRLAYSTYLGGSGGEEGRGIAVDRSGNAYVTGGTSSTDFPTAHPLATNMALQGPSDAFVVKLGTLRFEDREVDGAGDADEDR